MPLAPNKMEPPPRELLAELYVLKYGGVPANLPPPPPCPPQRESAAGVEGVDVVVGAAPAGAQPKTLPRGGGPPAEDLSGRAMIAGGDGQAKFATLEWIVDRVLIRPRNKRTRLKSRSRSLRGSERKQRSSGEGRGGEDREGDEGEGDGDGDGDGSRAGEVALQRVVTRYAASFASAEAVLEEMLACGERALADDGGSVGGGRGGGGGGRGHGTVCGTTRRANGSLVFRMLSMIDSWLASPASTKALHDAASASSAQGKLRTLFDLVDRILAGMAQVQAEHGGENAGGGGGGGGGGDEEEEYSGAYSGEDEECSLMSSSDEDEGKEENVYTFTRSTKMTNQEVLLNLQRMQKGEITVAEFRALSTETSHRGIGGNAGTEGTETGGDGAGAGGGSKGRNGGKGSTGRGQATGGGGSTARAAGRLAALRAACFHPKTGALQVPKRHIPAQYRDPGYLTLCGRAASTFTLGGDALSELRESVESLAIFSARGIAEELTRSTAARLESISDVELLKKAWIKKKGEADNPAGHATGTVQTRAPVITDLTDRYNSIYRWVQSVVLVGEVSGEERAKVLRKMICVAQELWALNNYFCLSAVVQGIHQKISVLLPLRSMWSCVGDRFLDQLAQLQRRSGEGGDNYAQYRREYAHAASRSDPRIPFFPAHLKDIAMGYDGVKSFHTEQEQLINVRKFLSVDETIEEIHRAQECRHQACARLFAHDEQVRLADSTEGRSSLLSRSSTLASFRQSSAPTSSAMSGGRGRGHHSTMSDASESLALAMKAINDQASAAGEHPTSFRYTEDDKLHQIVEDGLRMALSTDELRGLANKAETANLNAFNDHLNDFF